MYIQQRLTLLMVVIIVGAIGGAAIMGWSQMRTSAHIRQERSHAEAEATARVIALHSEPLIAYVADYTRWDEMLRFTRSCDAAWADANIAATLATFHADAAWIMHADTTPCYATDPTIGLVPAMLGLDEQPSIHGTTIHSFLMLDTTVWDVAAATIHPTTDRARATPPQGWFIVARRLNAAALRELGTLLNSQVSLVPVGVATSTSALHQGTLQTFYPLRNQAGITVAMLSVITSHPLLGELEKTAAEALVVLVAVNLLTFGLLRLGLSRWVVAPLRLLTRSVQEQQPAALDQLARERGEFGHLAELVQNFFAQRQALTREMAIRLQAEAALRSEHDFALQVMNTMGEGLTVTDADGRFTFVNDAYAHLFGYTPAELIGHSPFELTLEEDHMALMAAQLARQRGQPTTYTNRLRCADGRVALVQITGTPRMVDGQVVGAVAVITDLSERIAVEAALREAEQTLRSFFNSAGAMMGIVELYDDDILHITDNARTAAFFGTTVEALRGQRATALGVPPEALQQWLQAYQESVRSGQPVQFDYHHPLVTGPAWLAATVCCIGPAAHGQIRYAYVVTDITAHKALEEQLAAANAQLRELAQTDGLTGLRNRTAFDARLAEELARVARYHTPFSLLLIDIDYFKSYNDSFGHVAGDEVLRSIARLFQEQARQSDLVARYGGEEFALLLPNTDEAEATLVAERIRCSIAQAAWPQRAITISIGVATCCHSLPTEPFIALADNALYRAKAQGRNQVVHVGVAFDMEIVCTRRCQS